MFSHKLKLTSFLIISLALTGMPLGFAQANNTTPLKDQLKRVEDKLDRIEKAQIEQNEKQEQIIAMLEQLKVWVRRN